MFQPSPPPLAGPSRYFRLLKKWTVHVTSSEPPAKMPRFTTVPLKALFDISMNQKTIIFKFDFSLRCVSTFFNYKKQWRNSQKLQFFKLKKNDSVFHIFYQMKILSGTGVNKAFPSLHGESR